MLIYEQKNKRIRKQTSRIFNISASGKNIDKEKLKMVETAKEVPEFSMDGKTKIKLPEGIEHGVFVPEETAARLFALRPNDFKTPVLKSTKKTTSMPAKPVIKSQDKSTDEVNK